MPRIWVEVKKTDEYNCWYGRVFQAPWWWPFWPTSFMEVHVKNNGWEAQTDDEDNKRIPYSIAKKLDVAADKLIAAAQKRRESQLWKPYQPLPKAKVKL